MMFGKRSTEFVDGDDIWYGYDDTLYGGFIVLFNYLFLYFRCYWTEFIQTKHYTLLKMIIMYEFAR